MPNILIIADDLTGAADCGAAFAERGMETTVLLSGAVDMREIVDTQVLAIDADTRCLGPEQAAACVARIVHTYGDTRADSDPGLIFKKIDSTLRGNAGAELAATLEATREHASTRVVILLAPAFPACGRTTVNGRQFLYGKPLEDFDAPRRESPHCRSDIAAMIEEAGLACKLLALAQVRAGVSGLASAIRTAASASDVVILDAETEADLDAIVGGGMLLDSKTVWAGSAGLAVPLAAMFGGADLKRSPVPRVHGPALFVVGSPAEVSREQARALAAAIDLGVFTLPPSDILHGESASELEKKASFISQRLAYGGDVLVRFDGGDLYDVKQGRPLAQSLARMFIPSANHLGALFATGGETARAILDAWGIQHLRLLGELEPGIPYSSARCHGREILILTKAGGFGTRDTLIRCREFLHTLARDTDATSIVENQKS